MGRPEQYKWTVIYTDHNKKFIHLNHLERNNPDAQILLADTSNKFSRNFAWRNGDLLVREWLKNNYDKILYDNIAILEWDVLVNTKLPSQKITGLIGKQIYYPKNNWYWFSEINLLEDYKQYALGIVPFGVLFMDKKSIDVLLDSRFDFLFNKNIYSELRLPTILNSRNIKINSLFMPHVSYLPVHFMNEQHIYHPIKSKIDGFKKQS
jgi:hypothetical protein